MTNNSDTQLRSIDSATLTPLVRQVLDSEAVEVIDWDAEQIYAIRFLGPVSDQGQPLSQAL